MKKIVFALILAAVLTLTGSMSFAAGLKKDKAPDIKGHWAQSTIEKALDEGIVTVQPDGKLLPNSSVKRYEFVQMLHKALKIRIMYFKATDIGEFFSDVDNDEPYAGDLYDLVIANIIDFKGQFKPQSTLSREEAVHYIMNAYDYMAGKQVSGTESGSIENKSESKPNNFLDKGKISKQYIEDVNRAVELGLITGNGQGKFNPKAHSTKAEILTIIDRLVTVLEKQKTEVKVEPGFKLGVNEAEMSLTIANNSKSAVAFNHSSGQKYDFALLDAKRNEIFRWSDGRFFTLALTSTTIDAGKSVVYTEKLDVKEYKDVLDKAVYLKAYIAGTSDSFVIDKSGYELKIR